MENKHRINLTVPDSLHKQLQEYMKDHFFYCEATACLSLVIQALYAYEFKKCNTDLKAGAGCCGSSCVTTSPSPSA